MVLSIKCFLGISINFEILIVCRVFLPGLAEKSKALPEKMILLTRFNLV